MKAVKIAKLLDVFSYIAMLGVVIYYFFVKFEKIEYLILSLLGVCIIKMIASTLKASYYEKHYKQLEEDNEFLQRRINELTNNNK